MLSENDLEQKGSYTIISTILLQSQHALQNSDN